MSTYAQRVLVGVTYKPSWSLTVGLCDLSGREYLQWRFEGPCVKTGKVAIQPCRKWWLSQHMTESELVQTAMAAALQAEEHECREFFAYQGKRLFQPHISVRALMRVCDQEDVR
jgi:hypothetical protein